MDPIQEAIEGIESREDGASLLYLEVAKKSGLIDRRCRDVNVTMNCLANTTAICIGGEST